MAFRAFWQAIELEPFTYRPLTGSEIRRLAIPRALPRGYRFVLTGYGTIQLRIVRPIAEDVWLNQRTGERYESLKVNERPFRPRLFDPRTGLELPRLRLLMPLGLPRRTAQEWLEPFRRPPPPIGVELVEVTPFAYDLNPKDRIDPMTGLSRRPPRYRAAHLTPLRRFITREEVEELLREVGEKIEIYPDVRATRVTTRGLRGLRLPTLWLMRWAFPDRPTIFYDGEHNIFYVASSELQPEGGFTPTEASTAAFVVAGILGTIREKFTITRPFVSFDEVPDRDKPYIIEELIRLGRITEEEGRRLLS